MVAISETKSSSSQSKLQAKTLPTLPSTNIFENLIGGPELHVPDYAILDHIITHGKSIRGLAELLLYVRFVLQKSAGHINKPQWHSAKSICEVVGVSARQLRKLEENWAEYGFILKVDHCGATNERVLGKQFNAIRSNCVGGGQFEPGGEDNSGRGGRPNRAA